MRTQSIAPVRPMPSSDRTPSSARRRLIRYGAALAAFAAGILYLLTATGVLQVIDAAARAEQAPVFIIIAASVAFILGGVLLLAFDRRIVQILGAGVQVITIAGYFAVAPSRTPSFEVWGIVIKVVQVVLLAALVYLAATGPPRTKARQ